MKPVYITVRQINHVETGNVARMERLKHRLSLEQIAVKMGLTKMSMSNLEYGKSPWTEERVKKFNQAIQELRG